MPKHLEVSPHAEQGASPPTDLSVFPSANTHGHYIVIQSLKYEQIDYIFIWLSVPAPLL